MTTSPVRSARPRWLRVLLVSIALAAGLAPATALQTRMAFGPGARVLLDAHNAYPYEGKWQDRIDRALATGLPLAIEQDLIWRVGADGRGTSVVAHDLEHAGDAPTFELHFFERIRPIMEQALAAGPAPSWPMVVLNLDLKTDEPEHHQAIWETLGRYEHWLTTAPRTSTPETAEALTPGPLLVLTGLHPAQAARFHDAVPVGGRLRVFGAIDLPQRPGADGTAQAVPLTQVSADTLIPGRGSNYRRWVNFPWGVVEAGGPQKAGGWTSEDRQRLQTLVDRAHAMDLWIRFYTLNGHDAAGNQGWHAGYNFGSLAAAQVRWRAARDAGVDFIATDQYEAFAADR